MTEEKAIEDAEKDLTKKFPDFDCLVYEDPEEIIKGQYKPFSCYAITIEGSCIVADFLVILTQKKPADDCPKFLYTIYDQALGKNGIYRFI